MKIEQRGESFVAKVKPIHINDIKQIRFFKAEDKVVKYKDNAYLKDIVKLSQDEYEKIDKEIPGYKVWNCPDFIRNLSIRFKDEEDDKMFLESKKQQTKIKPSYISDRDYIISNMDWVITANYNEYYRWNHDDVCKPIILLSLPMFFSINISLIRSNETTIDKEIILSYEAGFLSHDFKCQYCSFDIKSDDTEGRLLTHRVGTFGKLNNDYPKLPDNFSDLSSMEKEIHEEILRRQLKKVHDIEYAPRELVEDFRCTAIKIEGILLVMVIGYTILEESKNFPYHHPDYPVMKGIFLSNPPQMKFVIKEEHMLDTKTWCINLGFGITQVNYTYKYLYTENDISRTYDAIYKKLQFYKSITSHIYTDEEELYPNYDTYKENNLK